MGIAEHFRIHGAVHAFWIISILVLIITALLLLVPNGSFLRDYISFASSIASIILAIIAIFYSMFSNQSFSEMVGSLQSSVQNTSQSSAKLEDASNFLTTLADRVSTEISSLSPRFDAVENKIEKGLLTDRIVNSSNLNGKNGAATNNKDKSTAGLTVAIYAIQKMSETSIEFEVQSAFETEAWQQYIAGCLSTISYFSPCGMTIKRVGSFGYSLASLGDLSLEDIKEILKSTKPNKNMMTAVDVYFDRKKEIDAS